MVKQYLDHSIKILSSDTSRIKFNERRGLGRMYIFGYQNRYDLNEGLPLLTTKKMPFKKIAHELIWFLRGDTNIKYLVDNNVHIWDDDAFNFNLKNMAKEGIFPENFKKFSREWYGAKDTYVERVKEDEEFAQRWGDLGPVYGSQWIHWPFFIPAGQKDSEGRELYVRDPKGINQIETAIQNMGKDVASARHVISAWNPAEVSNMALPPCHTMFQLNSDGESLDLQLYQRACDMFLGVPFNIASYAMLTHILANETGLRPGEFVHTFGDVHFYTGSGDRARWYRDNFDDFKKMVKGVKKRGDYLNVLEDLRKVLPSEPEGKEGMDHVTGILEQLSREPKKLPNIEIANKPYNKLTIDDFVLKDYNSHPYIRRALAV